MLPTLEITIDPTTSTPAYRQIVDQMRVLIVEGSLSAATELPPVRALARELSVHHNTVAEAYRTLAAEGVIEIAHGRRAVVAGPADAPAPEARKDSVAILRKRLREVVAECRARGVSASQIADELRGLTEALDA